MRLRRVLVAGMAIIGALAVGIPDAHAAGIVTHAWMGLDAIDHVQDSDLHALLVAHADQVRAGAEFPDGGYWTRSLGTPGGDYGEEAHWQRFVDAYTAQIRDDPSCGDLTDPNGPCAPTIAHLMGVAAHGMGDEVWDWLFEPNGPGFDESYLPAAFGPFAGPGGLELQMDIVAIMRHGRPTGPTVELPDPAKIDAAFRAAGRTDILASAFTEGERGLEVERSAETIWAPQHIAALERAMPWTSAHMVTTGGGVDFGARAIAGYFDTIWANLRGRAIRTRVSAVAPYAGQVDVPATGWTGSFSPGSNAGNSGGLTRIAVALSSALPYHPQAGQGSLPSELPAGALQLRDVKRGTLVPPRAGYPRIVPYNPEAGEHVVAFQPAGDLRPCTWYQVEVTRDLVDAQARPVTPSRSRFRTSGCSFPTGPRRVDGTVVCDASGGFAFTPALRNTATTTGAAPGITLMQLANCAGGQDGRPNAGATVQITSGAGGFHVKLPTGACTELTDPTGAATIDGVVAWYDSAGREIGRSTVDAQPFDLRGGVVTVRAGSSAFPGASLALRITPDAAGCGASPGTTVARFTAGNVTAWSS